LSNIKVDTLDEIAVALINVLLPLIRRLPSIAASVVTNNDVRVDELAIRAAVFTTLAITDVVLNAPVTTLLAYNMFQGLNRFPKLTDSNIFDIFFKFFVYRLVIYS
jgi:hypothetical protein